MSDRSPTNTAHSVHQRLLNLARKEDRLFNELFKRYLMERLLYRLAQSRHVGSFTLKGGLLLAAWQDNPLRPTLDIDLLGNFENTVEKAVAIFQDICSQEVTYDDGVVFDANSVTAERIIEDADYHGMRVTLTAQLGAARDNLQVDIGFADVIVPQPQVLKYPVLLDHPAPRLTAYSRESVIAEKFEAMVALGIPNSRMKDFADLWFLACNFEFDGTILAEAIHQTFMRRETPVEAVPVALTDSFSDDLGKQGLWRAFVNRARPNGVPAELAEIIAMLGEFLGPIAQSLAVEESFAGQWPPGGPWVC